MPEKLLVRLGLSHPNEALTHTICYFFRKNVNETFLFLTLGIFHLRWAFFHRFIADQVALDSKKKLDLLQTCTMLSNIWPELQDINQLMQYGSSLEVHTVS